MGLIFIEIKIRKNCEGDGIEDVLKDEDLLSEISHLEEILEMLYLILLSYKGEH
jgi:hypothetical protein